MHKCFKCGTEFEGNFCPECGEKYLEEKICPKCGEKLDGSAKFCNSCGYSFIGDSYNHHKEKAPEKMEKLYNFLTSFPSILFMILSVALMLLFLLPVAIMPGGEIMGEKIPSESYGNVYQLSNFDDTPFKGTLTILMVFGIIGLFIALIISLSNVFYKFKYKHITIANKKIFIKDIFTGIGYIIFFIIFILSCTLLGQISSFDEGMGVISGGLSPILTLVLTLISILLYGGSLVLKYYLIKKYPSLNDTMQDKINESKPTKVETWLNHHKKLMVLFSGILVIAIAVSIIVPTILVNIHNGVYYEYNAETELYNKEKYYRLKGESWEDEEGNQGSIIFNGEDVTLSFELFGEKMELEGTIVKDVLKVNDTVYAKDNHEHKFDKWEVIDEGSCTELATEASDCPCGKHEIRKINQLVQHNFVNGKEATCADWGVEGTYCTLCGRLGENSQYIEPLHVRYYEADNKYGCVKGISKECNHQEIVIPDKCIDSGRIWSVKHIASSAFMDCKALKSIVLPNSVTRIGDYAFKGCSSLTNIKIPSSLTSIGWEAFSGCTSLTSIEIPNGVSSINYGAFKGCISLEKVNISNLNAWINIEFKDLTSNPLYFAHNLYVNDNIITTLLIPNTITDIKTYVFAGGSFKNISIPSSVTNIGTGTFNGCTNLTSIVIPSSVTNIGSKAFVGCSSLIICCEASEQPDGWAYDWNGGRPFYWGLKVEDIIIQDGVQYLIAGGEAQVVGNVNNSNVTIPSKIEINNKQYAVTSIGNNAFYGCTSLKSVELSESLTSIGDDAFNGCTSLTYIFIPSNVTKIGENTFKNCTSLTIYCEVSKKPDGWDSDWCPNGKLIYWSINKEDIIIQDGLQYLIVDGEAKITGYLNRSELNIPSKITINGVQYDVTSIANYAFRRCSWLASINIPNSVTSIGDYAFSACTSLTSIEIPNSITSIESGTFNQCTSLINIVLPNSVTSIEYGAFWGCTSLASITLTNSVTTIEDSAFTNCNSLTIYCEATSKPNGWGKNWLGYGDNPVYWGINDNNYLEQKGVIYVVIDGKVAVTGHTSKIENNVTIPSKITINGVQYDVTSIANYAFCGCSWLASINIPNSVTRIGDYAFSACTSLINIVLPNSVTNIGSYSFAYCESLKSIVIPNSVTTIEDYAFLECDCLTIYCEATSKPSGWKNKWEYDETVYWGGEWSYVDGVPTPNE